MSRNRKKAIRELIEIDTHEVSHVDKPANDRAYLVIKREGGDNMNAEKVENNDLVVKKTKPIEEQVPEGAKILTPEEIAVSSKNLVDFDVQTDTDRSDQDEIQKQRAKEQEMIAEAEAELIAKKQGKTEVAKAEGVTLNDLATHVNKLTNVVLKHIDDTTPEYRGKVNTVNKREDIAVPLETERLSKELERINKNANEGNPGNPLEDILRIGRATGKYV